MAVSVFRLHKVYAKNAAAIPCFAIVLLICAVKLFTVVLFYHKRFGFSSISVGIYKHLTNVHLLYTIGKRLATAGKPNHLIVRVCINPTLVVIRTSTSKMILQPALPPYRPCVYKTHIGSYPYVDQMSWCGNLIKIQAATQKCELDNRRKQRKRSVSHRASLYSYLVVWRITFTFTCFLQTIRCVPTFRRLSSQVTFLFYALAKIVHWTVTFLSLLC